jgi:hypothetical protein
MEFGIPLIQRLIKPLTYLRILREANTKIFREYIRPWGPEEEPMEKYGVEIDPTKIEKEKIGSKGGKPINNPNVNVPLDPKEGTKPYEKDPDDAKTP